MCYCSLQGTTTLGAIIHNVTAGQWNQLANQAAGAGYDWLYITDLTLPNPYATLPSYWQAESNFRA